MTALSENISVISMGDILPTLNLSSSSRGKLLWESSLAQITKVSLHPLAKQSFHKLVAECTTEIRLLEIIINISISMAIHSATL